MEDFVGTAPPQVVTILRDISKSNSSLLWNLTISDSQVVDAMRHTITNMLGSLPPQFFDVKVSTVGSCLCWDPMFFRSEHLAMRYNLCAFVIQMGENLSQLMYSVMMTGYMIRNAEVGS